MAVRFIILATVFGLAYSALGFNLYTLQVKKQFRYVALAEARRNAAAELDLRRGQIVFTNDRLGTTVPVALNRDFPVIFAVPKELENPQEAAQHLAAILGLNETNLATAFANRESQFKLLVDKATKEQVSAVETLALRGVYVDTKQYRSYQYGSLASHLIGFVGVNDKNPKPTGLYGLEKKFDTSLANENNLLLTIDHEIQSHAEKILADLIALRGATGGTVIVQDPQTGAVRALVNKPDFDPNRYSEAPVSHFVNAAVQSVYEPGSVMKPMTVSAGINLGVITPQTTYVDTGSVLLNGKRITNANDKVYGKVTVKDVLMNSINTGSVFVEQKIGHERFTAYLRSFGFGEVTGVDMPDEVRGDIRNLDRKEARAVDFATASFGQGMAVTPLQLITAYSVLANGGLLMKPFVVQGKEPYVVRRVIAEKTAQSVTDMLIATVDKAGIAAIPKYRVAGKTGTAYIPDFTRGGYTDELIHTFVGFAPASAPRFTILIKLDKPQVGELAGITVVPAFRELAEFLINYYGIAPDRLPVASSSPVR